MHTVEVDFEVWKKLTELRKSERDAYNDVLRRLLKLTESVEEPAKKERPATNGMGWRTKGVYFPEGTEFRAKYKGVTYTGRVERGALVVNGRRFDASSRAASSITKNLVNGWVFWEARRPGEADWHIIKSFRRD
ncbi:MAG TPA: hypothetical protein VMY69_03515 [Phycisphaerae bacterium]|nr:hypothetical protein [Phycisphaerae bacterium]